MSAILFNLDQMKRFEERDLLISRMVMDLKRRNPNMDEEKVYEIIFNSEVLEDREMEEAYQLA